jgi:tetratricopeptide (TPR) repeat protein
MQQSTAADNSEGLGATQSSAIQRYLKLAPAEEKLNQLENAVFSYYRIINLNPNLPEAFINLGRVYKAMHSLNTRIVNGAATTSDALWPGVPVLTLQGSHFASIMSSSILSAVGLQEMITYDLKTYETLAVCLAQNPERLNSISKKLAENRLTEPLFDALRFTTNLERAYERMWTIYLAGEKPRRINVIEN